MRRKILLLVTAFALISPLECRHTLSEECTKVETPFDIRDQVQALYDAMCPDGCVGSGAFEQAYEGYCKIANKSREVLTLIDFSLPSTEPRLFVFDIPGKKMLFKSVVAHGRNSGGNYATSFSNKPGSYKSSLGFYLTTQTYQGKNGYSLRLKGLEKGINDMAEARAIVIHGAKYADPKVCASGRLGRSLGCPALPERVNRTIIDAIKGGSVLFIYSGSEDYRTATRILEKPEESHGHDLNG